MYLGPPDQYSDYRHLTESELRKNVLLSQWMLNEKKAHKEEEQARMYAFMGDLYESKFKKFNKIRDQWQTRRDSFRNSFGSPQRNLHLQSPNRSRYRQSPNQSRASIMSPLRYSPRPLANSTPTRPRMSPSATVTSPVEQSETPASAVDC